MRIELMTTSWPRWRLTRLVLCHWAKQARKTITKNCGKAYFTNSHEGQCKKCGTLHDFACHPCAGAMLIFSVSFRDDDVSQRNTNQQPVKKISRTTDWRKRTKEVKRDVGKFKKARKEYSCSKCHQPMSSEGHTQFKGKRFCSTNEGKTKEEWLAEMRSAAHPHKWFSFFFLACWGICLLFVYFCLLIIIG